MMRIDFYFDFDNDNFQQLNNLIIALNSFIKKEEVTITFRSYPKNDKTYLFHQIYHFGRKLNLGISFLVDLFNLFLNISNLNDSLLSLSYKYNFNLTDLNDVLTNNSNIKIVKNQHEYAGLLKINQSPTLIFSHGFKLNGISSPLVIKETLIKMYEKDSGIEYCEDDCEK